MTQQSKGILWHPAIKGILGDRTIKKCRQRFATLSFLNIGKKDEFSQMFLSGTLTFLRFSF